MKKIFAVLCLCCIYSSSAIADTISACDIELQTNEYEPDLILSEKYKTAGIAQKFFWSLSRQLFLMNLFCFTAQLNPITFCAMR